jgi:hypothetical protein
MDNPIVVSTRHMDAPWIATNLAVLNEAAVNVRLDVHFQVLAAKRTRDHELVRHSGNPTATVGSLCSHSTIRCVECLQCFFAATKPLTAECAKSAEKPRVWLSVLRALSGEMFWRTAQSNGFDGTVRMRLTARAARNGAKGRRVCW